MNFEHNVAVCAAVFVLDFSAGVVVVVVVVVCLCRPSAGTREVNQCVSCAVYMARPLARSTTVITGIAGLECDRADSANVALRVARFVASNVLYYTRYPPRHHTLQFTRATLSFY